MKTKTKSVILRTIFLLLMSFGVYSQDASFTTVSVSPSSTVSPLDQFTISYSITNNDAFISIGDGIDLDIAFDDLNFSYNSFSSTDTSWTGCTVMSVTIPGVNGGTPTPGVSCSYQGTLTPSPISTIDIVVDVGSIAASAMYNFEANLRLATFVNDSNLGNNRDTQVITVGGASSPDYNLVIGPNGSPINIDSNSTASLPFSFDLSNVGTGLGSSFEEFVYITVANNFSLSGLSMANIVSNGFATWNCNLVGGAAPTDNDWQCSNIESVGGMAVNDSARITGSITSYVTTNDTLAALNATITASSDFNSANDSVDIDIAINAAPLADMQFSTGISTTQITLASGDTSPQTIDYQVVNNGADAINGAVVTYTFDDTLFNLAEFTTPVGWGCLFFTAPSLMECKIFSNFTSGSTADFQITLSALPSTGSGIYSSAVVADVFEFFGAKNTSKSKKDPVQVKAVQIVTNVEILLPLSDPDIIIDKTFGNGFSTNTITQASAGSFVTYKILAKAIDSCLGPAAKSTQLVKGCSPASNGANVQIVDTLPPGVSFDSFNVLGPNFSCSESAGTITCTTSSLPITTADDGVEISVLVSGNVGDVITNTSTITADNDANSANNSSSPGSFTVVATLPTTLSINKQVVVLGVPVDTVPKGSAFTYRLAVKNTGNSNAINLQVTDDMPAGVLVNGFSGAGWSCTNTGQQYTCNYPGPLGVGATTFLEFNVIDNSAPDVTQLLNVASLSADNAPTVSGALFTNLTDISFDLKVTQNPNPIEENKPFEFLIEIVNTGTQEIIGAEVVNMLPDGFTYNPIAKSSTCMINGPEMLCTVDTPIAAGATEIINIGVQAVQAVDSNATYTNVTTVSGGNIISATTVNTVTNVNVTGAGSGGYNYNIFLTSDIVDTVETETPFNYTVNLENTGSLDITFMDVAISLPSDLTILSMMTSGFSCSPASTGLDCSADVGFNLASGSNSDIIVLEVQSSSFTGDVMVGLSSNIGTVLERNADNTTNIISGTSTADLSVEVLPGSAIDQGGTSDFEVQVVNNGPQDAENVTLSMAITGILDDVVVTPGNEWECQVNNLAIDCQFSSALMTVGQQSSVFVTVNTSRVVLDAEDLVLIATVATDSDDPEISNNTASSSVGVSGTPTEGDIGDALRDVLGGSGDQQTDGAIDAVAGYCEVEYFTALEQLCDDLYSAALSGDRDAVARFLKEITPSEVIGQSTSLNEIALAQFRNVGARLNQLRGGGGSGFSSAGLNARYGNGSIPLGMLAYLNKSEEEGNSGNIDTNNDFISPWGFFVNGTVSMGKRDATGRELGFEFDTFGLTAGLDYRIDSKKVIGVAVGYANFDSTIEGSAKLNSTGVTLTGYGSFYVNDNFYLDARISLAKPQFEQSRKIDFTLGSTRFDRTAVGDTSSNQYSISMSGGYSFYKNAWNITPNASFTYVSTNIDSFTESGAGDFNIVYSEQDVESLVWSTGIRVSKAVSLKRGVITPQFDLDYNYQGLNDGNTIEARFINAPIDQMFILQTDTPDRSYGSAGLGLVYISANGKQAYFNYRSLLGLEGFSKGTFNIGARFEF